MELLQSEYSSFEDCENMEIYTTAEYDDYYFVFEWFDEYKLDVKNFTDEQIEKLAEQEVNSANKQGIGLLGDIEEYLIELRDSN